MWMSIGSTLVLPTAEELARFGSMTLGLPDLAGLIQEGKPTVDSSQTFIGY